MLTRILSRFKNRESLSAVLLFFPGLPLSIILHELGHYLTALALGHEATLSFASVYFVMEVTETNTRDNLLVTLAGPVTNLLIAILGAIGLRKFLKKNDLSTPAWCWIWFFSICSVSGLRGGSKLFHSDGAPSDESFLFEHFQITAPLSTLILALPSLFFLGILLHFHFKKSSLPILFLGFLSGSCGIALWLSYLGPLLLPAPS